MMSTKMKKGSGISSSKIAKMGRKDEKSGKKKSTSTLPSPTPPLTTKGSQVQRQLSQSSMHAHPQNTLTRKSSQSSVGSTSRRVSQVSAVSQVSESSMTNDGGRMLGLQQSLQSLMITKRMARSLRQRTSRRLADLRGSSYISYVDRPRQRSASERHQHLPQIENTYLLDPPEKFALHLRVIRDIIGSVVESRLDGVAVYDPSWCAREAQEMSDVVKERVKTLDIRRYKLIAVVHIGKMAGQGLVVSNKSVWDPGRDSFVSYRFQNGALFCVATIYGVYFE